MIRTFLAALLGLAVSAGSAAAQCTIPNTLTNGTNADATQVMANFNALLTCLNNLPTATPVTPQGRLTLVSGTPVMTASQTGKTVIYYTPYNGNQVQIYNGTTMVPTAFTELSNITTNGATGNAGPAAVVASSNYDLFAWSNSGTVTLTRGPAWTSDTARGTGAGTTELQRINGIWTNKNAITNGPAANLGTYVGTVRSDGANQINFSFGGIGAGGTAAVLGVWNTYNRVEVDSFVGDSTPGWQYTTATWRAANASSTMRVSYVLGLQDEYVNASYGNIISTNTAAADAACVAVGVDSTSAPSGRVLTAQYTNAVIGNLIGEASSNALGFHFMQALEITLSANGTTSFYGSSSSSRQSGLLFKGRF